MRSQYIIKLTKEECMDETLEALKYREEAEILKRNPSEIKFKRGSFWTLETTAKSSRIIASIKFKGNKDKTEIKEELKLGESMILEIITYVVLGILLIILINQLFPAIPEAFYKRYLAGNATYSEYVDVFYISQGIMEILIIIVPIALITSIVYSFYLKTKGLQRVMENIYSMLSARANKEIRSYKDNPLNKEKETIIKHVKVIYDLPEKCPSCGAPLQYEAIKLRGPNKAECAYCNLMFDLIEKEI